MLADQRDEERLTAEALAVELAEANVQLRARQEVLELLQELTTLANSSLSLVEIGGRVLELMHQRLDLKAATIYEVDAQADLLRLLALGRLPGRAGRTDEDPPHRRRVHDRAHRLS